MLYRTSILVVLFIILNPLSAVGTVYVTDGSYSDVATKVSGASSGDIITMPSGSFDWGSNTLTLTKNIILQGSGISNTVITSTTGTMIDITNANASGCRITGFKVNKTSGYFINVHGVVVIDFRFDHIYMNYASNAEAIIIDYGAGAKTYKPQGLIDKCHFHNCKFLYYSTCHSRYDWQTFADPRNLGGVDAVYVEDCIFDNDSYTVTANIGDADCGACFVVRYCDVSGRGFYTHGIQDNHIFRTTMKFEAYRNNMDGQNSQGGAWLSGTWRAASPIVWQNQCEDYSTSGWQIYDYHYATGDTEGGLEPCDGDELHDSNYGVSDSAGWLCFDQPGSGPDKALRTEGNPYVDQTPMPVYVWGNTYDGSPSNSIYGNASYEAWFKADRDYFVEGGTIGVSSGTYANLPATCKEGQGYWCTDCGSWNQANSTVAPDWNGQQGVLYRCKLVGDYYDGEQSNEWEIYYTPYIYPHPLRKPAAPTNLIIKEIE